MGFLKKIIFGKSKQEPNTGERIATKIKEKSQKVFGAVNEKFNQAVDEIFLIRKKFGNLLETNYQLGLTHLEKGNLSDAIFRFRFIKKFWPEHYQSYHQLAYCLLLDDNPQEAEDILVELMNKNPNCDQLTQDLLVRVRQAIKNKNAQSINSAEK